MRVLHRTNTETILCAACLSQCPNCKLTARKSALGLVRHWLRAPSPVGVAEVGWGRGAVALCLRLGC
jgi:hypothetical protein